MDLPRRSTARGISASVMKKRYGHCITQVETTVKLETAGTNTQDGSLWWKANIVLVQRFRVGILYSRDVGILARDDMGQGIWI